MSWQSEYTYGAITESELNTIRKTVDTILNSELPRSILIHGETGTGKTLLARVLSCYYTDKNTEHYMINGDTSSLEGDIIIISGQSALSSTDFNSLDKSKVIIVDDINLMPNNTLNKLYSELNNLENNPAIICIGSDSHNKYELTIELKRTHEEIVHIIKSILKKENVEYTDESINKIVYYCDTNIRKCINAVECISKQYDKIDKQSVESYIEESK